MRGGKREGAGRPKGARDGSGTSRAVRKELTEQIAQKALEDGIMPLEIMLAAMRDAWGQNDREKAVLYAEKAAPYMHHKLAAVQHSGDKDNPLAIAVASSVPRDDADDDDQRHPAQSH